MPRTAQCTVPSPCTRSADTGSQEAILGYARRIDALVNKYAPWPCATRWVSLEDYRSEAWEAVCRTATRYHHLDQADRENLTVAAVRNALLNLRNRALLSDERTPAIRQGELRRVRDRREPLEEALAWEFLRQSAARLRPPARRVLDAIVRAHRAAGARRVTSAALARELGLCVDTVRARRAEVEGVLLRELVPRPPPPASYPQDACLTLERERGYSRRANGWDAGGVALAARPIVTESPKELPLRSEGPAPRSMPHR